MIHDHLSRTIPEFQINCNHQFSEVLSPIKTTYYTTNDDPKNFRTSASSFFTAIAWPTSQLPRKTDPLQINFETIDQIAEEPYR